jgi:hypothetical protein
MTRNDALRAHLRKLLDWEDAHVNFERAVTGMPARLQGVVPKGLPYSAWQLVEHLRLTQFDILDFCRNPDYEQPSSMDEYWPETAAPPNGRAWRRSINLITRDRKAMIGLAGNRRVDLFARIPHGTGQTYLRELLLVADHTAYHVGQLILVRRLLGDWTS